MRIIEKSKLTCRVSLNRKNKTLALNNQLSSLPGNPDSDTIKQCIRAVSVSHSAKTSIEFEQPWYDFACCNARNRSFQKFREAHDYNGADEREIINLRELAKSANKEYKNICYITKRSTYFDNLGCEINTIKSSQDWWAWAKKLKNQDGISSNGQIDCATVRNFFSNSVNRPDTDGIHFCAPDTKNEALDQPFTKLEIQNALKSMKTGKGSGEDGITLEFYSCAPDLLHEFLEKNFNQIMNGAESDLSNKSIIIAFHKKGGFAGFSRSIQL